MTRERYDRQVLVRFTANQHAALTAIARSLDRPVSWVVRRAVEVHLNETCMDGHKAAANPTP